MARRGEENEVWQHLEVLAGISDDTLGLTRTFLSPAHARAKRQVALWMVAAGMQVFEDGSGNLIGRLSAPDPDAPVIACGSHIDTVRNAGRFDGALGIVLGVAAAAHLARLQLPMRAHLEVVAFSDEEGVRFGSTYLGSKTYVGTLRETDLAVLDDDGLSLRAAIDAHRTEFPSPPPRATLEGYVEVHIEQGPVLEHMGLAVGVATAIAGQTRARVIVDGRSGHAGTTPMDLRQDALAGAAACVVLVEHMARSLPGLVGTVGDLRVRDGAGNVIAGHVEFSVDIRHVENHVRDRFCRNLFAAIERELSARQLGCQVLFPMVQPAVQGSLRLTNLLARAVEQCQEGPCPRLISGAGHDVAAIAAGAETALLFVRCRAGLSHHPDEYAAPEDVAMALSVLIDFLEDLVLQ